MMNQVKMMNKMRKLQKELTKELIVVEAGDGAVKVTISGDQKIKSIEFNPDVLSPDNVTDLENWTKIAVTEAIDKSQKMAAEKLGPMMQGLGLGG